MPSFCKLTREMLRDKEETREIRHITSGLARGSGTCSDGYGTASDIQLRC